MVVNDWVVDIEFLLLYKSLSSVEYTDEVDAMQ